MAKRKPTNTLTTIADLGVNDVFTRLTGGGSIEYRIISKRNFFKRRHAYCALAIPIDKKTVKPKPFTPNETVIYITTMIVV